MSVTFCTLPVWKRPVGAFRGHPKHGDLRTELIKFIFKWTEILGLCLYLEEKNRIGILI